MKRRTAGLSVITLVVAYASGALSAPSDREAAPPSQDMRHTHQFAKGSPASKMFGNPFKAPSDTMVDFEPTGSISTGGKTQPSENGKTDASPSLTTSPAKKRN